MEPDEFLKKLRTGEFRRQLVFHGMVKDRDGGHDEDAERNEDAERDGKREYDGDTIQFAHGARCDDWIPVPVDAIESIDVMSVLPCDDHNHPFVRLELEAPETDEGKLFADLLGSGTTPLGSGTTRTAGPPPGTTRAAAGPPPGTTMGSAGGLGLFQMPTGPFSPGGGGCYTYCDRDGVMWCLCPRGNGDWRLFACGSCPLDPIPV